MAKKALRSLICILIFTVFLAACDQRRPAATAVPSISPAPTLAPTGTPIPTTTTTITPTPTTAPTATKTMQPTQTKVPEPTTLTGSVYLVGQTNSSFITTIELRGVGDFDLIATANTDADGAFSFPDVKPGFYDLWVLITDKPEMLPGCSEVTAPDESWRLGISFAADQAMTMGNAGLSKAIMLANNLDASVLKAQAFYAVLPEFKNPINEQNTIEVALFCE